MRTRHKALIFGGAAAVIIVALAILSQSARIPELNQDSVRQAEEQKAREAIFASLAAGKTDPGTVEDRRNIFEALQKNQ